MGKRETIVLMSRGMRLARLFKEAANELAGDFNVIALVNEEEYKLWSDVDREVRVINFSRAFREEAAKVSPSALYDMVRKIEDKLKLSVFKAANNYILYRKFVREYRMKWQKWYSDDLESMLRHYVGSYMVLSKIFEEHRPSLVFYETPDLEVCRIATAMACAKGIFALGFKFSPHNWDDKTRIRFAYGWRNSNILLEHYYKNKNLITDESYKNGRNLIRRVTEKYEDPALLIMAYKKEALDMSRWSTLVPAAALKLGYGLLTLQPARFTRLISNIIWVNKNFHRDIPKEDYIVFFMHNQPEASTCCQIPRWINQETIIEQLAINGPFGLKILVKEHTRNFGYRGRSYYGEFSKMFNIHLCHPTVDTGLILSHAKAILTLVGTVGFEGVLMGKKVAVLGRPYYSIFKGVKKLDYPEEIFDALKDPSWRPEEMIRERDEFAGAYAQSLYEFGSGKGKKLFPKSGGEKWASAIRDFLKKREEYKLKPDMFDKGYE